MTCVAARRRRPDSGAARSPSSRTAISSARSGAARSWPRWWTRSGPRYLTATAERVLLSAARAYVDGNAAQHRRLDTTALLACPEALERAEVERVAPPQHARN